MVEWFDEEKKVSVVENEKICEYTTNMHLVRESVYLQNLVQKACRGANQYLEANNATVASQVERFKELEPLEEFINPKKRKSKTGSVSLWNQTVK